MNKIIARLDASDIELITELLTDHVIGLKRGEISGTQGALADAVATLNTIRKISEKTTDAVVVDSFDPSPEG